MYCIDGGDCNDLVATKSRKQARLASSRRPSAFFYYSFRSYVHAVHALKNAVRGKIRKNRATTTNASNQESSQLSSMEETGIKHNHSYW